MKKRYRVTYVGNDSFDHTTTVWADDEQDAKDKVKRLKDADFVDDAERVSNPLVVAAVWLAILSAFILVCRHLA